MLHGEAWEKWIVDVLLENDRSACSVHNIAGQLPLHCALASYHDGDYESRQVRSTYCLSREDRAICPNQSRTNIIFAITEAFPEAVSVMDPISRLMPFQLAAIRPDLSLEVVYYLLRRAPAALLTFLEDNCNT